MERSPLPRERVGRGVPPRSRPPARPRHLRGPPGGEDPPGRSGAHARLTVERGGERVPRPRLRPGFRKQGKDRSRDSPRRGPRQTLDRLEDRGPAVLHALGAVGGVRTGTLDPPRLPSLDRAYPPDPGPSESHGLADRRRSALRRATPLGDRGSGGRRALPGLPPPGPPRAAAHFRPPGEAGAAGGDGAVAGGSAGAFGGRGPQAAVMRPRIARTKARKSPR